MKASRQNRWDNADTRALFEAVLGLNNAGEARRFLRDLLTEAELVEFGKRWRAARMLAQKESYAKIIKTTSLSSTTVARVQKWLTRGLGGYRLALKRQGLNNHHRAKTALGNGLR